MKKEKDKALAELAEKIKKMDPKGVAILNRDANTILTYQEELKNEEGE